MTEQKPSREALEAWLALTRGSAPSDLQGRTIALPVLSGSMLPDIPPGTTLLITPIAPDACRVGDVVVFSEGQYRLVAHRLLWRLRLGRWSWCFQKGDNNPFGGWIRSRRICGLALRLAAPGEDGTAPVEQSVLYKPQRVRQSLRAHLRNRLLLWPRRIRKRLFGVD